MSARPLLLRPAIVLCVLAVAALSGCSDGRLKIYPVTGQVLYNGQPLKSVDIALHPVDPKNNVGYPPHATTDADGTFALTTYLKGDGAPAGDYRVAVAFAVESIEDGSDQTKRLAAQVPVKYHRAETSGISVVVRPEPNTLDPIRLEGQPLSRARR
jgi:hypothetical protein